MDEIRPHYRAVKTVLRRSALVDPYFVGKFAFSPYQACAHGCRYCDGRAERYYVEGVFDRDIVVRRNAPEVLAVEVGRLRERGVVFVGSGVSDAYQPLEAGERLMPACGRVLADARLPVTILTKSSLIARDIDLWSEVHHRAGFVLMVSLVTLDDRLRALTEPGASPIESRLETLGAFKARGCAVGVAAMPLLPFLSDGEADIEALVERCARTGVDFVLPGGLTLRPGRQKETFFETLATHLPDLVPRYERLYAEDRPSGAPRHEYLDEVQRRAEAACARVGLPTLVPHRIYRDRLPVYDEVDVLLQHMSRLYAHRALDVGRLDAARRRYRAWLVARKKEMGRRRRQTEADVTDDLRALASSDQWGERLGNERLAGFLRQVILERRVFDERTLRLVDPGAVPAAPGPTHHEPGRDRLVSDDRVDGVEGV